MHVQTLIFSRLNIRHKLLLLFICWLYFRSTKFSATIWWVFGIGSVSVLMPLLANQTDNVVNDLLWIISFEIKKTNITVTILVYSFAWLRSHANLLTFSFKLSSFILCWTGHSHSVAVCKYSRSQCKFSTQSWITYWLLKLSYLWAWMSKLYDFVTIFLSKQFQYLFKKCNLAVKQLIKWKCWSFK